MMMAHMSHVPEIDVHGAKTLLDTGAAAFVDIRDPNAFAAGHIPGAAHLTNQTMDRVVEGLDRERPIVVYCYHGNSSLSATAWLQQQGFAEAVSMAGGFEAWRSAYPDDRTTQPTDGSPPAGPPDDEMTKNED